MLLVVLGANINQTFNEYQTVHTECYTDDTSMIYNKNINQITVYVFPTLKKDCFAFPRGVEVQLILKNDATPILSIVLTNFSYQNTTSFVFTLTNTFDTETFAVLNIFSYSQIAQVDIFVFEEQKSALDQCYKPTSTLQVKPTQITLSFTPTGLCSQQITTITDATDPTLILNELVSVTLNMMGTIVQLTPADFANSYPSPNKKTITLTLELDILLQYRQEATPSATIEFTSNQGSLQVTFQHKVNSVKLLGLDLAPAGMLLSFYHPFYTVLGLWDEGFLTRVENAPNFPEKLQTYYDKQNFTQYVLRLTATLPTSTLTLQTTIFSHSYSPYSKVRLFECNQGSTTEQTACHAFHTLAQTHRAVYTYDTLFYANSDFLFAEKVILSECPSCWSSAVLLRGKNSICVQLITGAENDRCNKLLPPKATVKSLLTFQFMNLDTQEQFSEARFYVQGSIMLSREVDQYCIDCDGLEGEKRDFCYKNKEMLAHNDGKVYVNIMFDSEDPEYYFEPSGLIVVTQRTSNFDYTGMKIASFVVGGGVFVACLALSVYGIVMVVRSVKASKHRGKKGQ